MGKAVAVIDSGVGGLTVFKELRKIMPKEFLIYFGDTARVPYGIRSKETVKRYALEVVKFLKKFKLKMLVVACNTTSAVALNEIKNEVDVPVIDVITPGAKKAASINGRILVIGTPLTINSHIYLKKIKKYNKAVKVYEKSTPLFVPIVEEGLENTLIALNAARMYLKGFSDIDAVVLGCTHYPLLKKTISKVIDAEIIDSSMEVAKHATRFLSENGSGADEVFFVTDAPLKFKELARRFLNRDVEVKKVCLK